jgi:hypothetical protein
MSDVQPTRVTVEFESGSEPMSGRMMDEGGRSRPFTGWLGLAAALGSVLRNEPPSPAEQPSAARRRKRAGGGGDGNITGPADVI